MSDLQRHLLEKYFGDDPRLVAAFEDQAAAVEANSTASQSAVEGTNAIKEASLVTLSENAEFTNERVLLDSDSIEREIGDGTLKLKVKDVVRSQDFTVKLVPTGDSELGVPESGDLISSQKVTTLGNFASDAAAAGGGVPIGGLYHNAGVLRVRLV